jgi:hypothetical protein
VAGASLGAQSIRTRRADTRSSSTRGSSGRHSRGSMARPSMPSDHAAVRSSKSRMRQPLASVPSVPRMDRPGTMADELYPVQ